MGFSRLAIPATLASKVRFTGLPGGTHEESLEQESMSDNAAEGQVSAWLQPLAGDTGPCGADLEYDNDFLELSKAIAGKPETQFEPAEPPNWRRAIEICESLFERTRDLRVAVSWLRGMLHVQGWPAYVPGMRLVLGLVEGHWDGVHPLPDPDDQDPYARVNALTLLREAEGLIGDLREMRVIQERSIGELTGRAVEVALGLSPTREGETDIGTGPCSQMMAAALEKDPALRALCAEASALTARLAALLKEKLGVQDAPDLKPLTDLVDGIGSLLPKESPPEDEADAGAPGDAAPGEGGGRRRGLSGSVNSREEALRAIDLVCEYLERAEPSNPAPLFLRRARQLVSHNFLQLMKVLAPDALPEVARLVGVDPDSVETPDGP